MSANALRGVEIFMPGTHNGEPYTEADIEELVRNAQMAGFSPAVKIGHDEGQDAHGWVENIRRVGQKLVADLTHLTDDAMRRIRERRLDRISAELFLNFRKGGRLIGKVLKAVALLGKDVPAIPDLAPLHKALAAHAVAMMGASADSDVRLGPALVFDNKPQDEETLAELFARWKVLSAEKDQERRTLEARLRESEQELQRLRTERNRLLRLHTERGEHEMSTRTRRFEYLPPSTQLPPVMTQAVAGELIDRAIKRYRLDHPEADYETAHRQILQEAQDNAPVIFFAYADASQDPRIRRADERRDAANPPRTPAERRALHNEVSEFYRRFQETHPGADLSEALDTHPALKARYLGS